MEKYFTLIYTLMAITAPITVMMKFTNSFVNHGRFTSSCHTAPMTDSIVVARKAETAQIEATVVVAGITCSTIAIPVKIKDPTICDVVWSGVV